MKYTHEIVGTHEGALLPESAPGACSGSKIPRVYRPLDCRTVERIILGGDLQNGEKGKIWLPRRKSYF